MWSRIAQNPSGVRSGTRPDGSFAGGKLFMTSIAYFSNESGSNQVYVRPFPNTADAKWQVSTNRGTFPLWAHSGRELFYQNGVGELVSVEVVPGRTFAMGQRRVLFSLSGYSLSVNRYDVTPDDQRFVMIRFRGGGDDSELIVVENFFEELKAKVGN